MVETVALYHEGKIVLPSFTGKGNLDNSPLLLCATLDLPVLRFFLKLYFLRKENY